MKNIKLIYSKKHNQYYRPISIDEDSKICKIVVAKNKRDKAITRNQIAKIEEHPDWKYVVMKNEHITAEENFINSMRVPGEYNRKNNELIDFQRHGLVDSEVAMTELSRIFHEGFKNVKSEQDRHFRNRVKTLYEELMTEQTKNDNKRSYDQRVPSEIIAIAKEKGLLIERNDDYITKKGSRVKPTKKELARIRESKPCGYLIRGLDMKVVAANNYKFTSRQVVEFVKRYTPYDFEKERIEMAKHNEFKYVYDEENKVVYNVVSVRHSDDTLMLVKSDKKSVKHTMDDVLRAGFKMEILEDEEKETQFEWFDRMLHSNNPKSRKAVVNYNNIKNIPEIEDVIGKLEEVVLNEPQKEVYRMAYKTLEKFDRLTAKVSEIYSQREKGLPVMVDTNEDPMKKEEVRNKKPLTDKLKVGAIWYKTRKGSPTEYDAVEILEIISDTRVKVKVLTKRGGIVEMRADKLHKTGDKAVMGQRAQARARQRMAEELNKKIAKGVSQLLIDKIKQLSENGNIRINRSGKYVVSGVSGFCPQTDTEKHLEKLIDEKLLELHSA